jgi:hypothetical protein
MSAITPWYSRPSLHVTITSTFTAGGVAGTYACMYVCLYVCIYVSIFVCMYVCMYVCIFVCMYEYMYKSCMYVHTGTRYLNSKSLATVPSSNKTWQLVALHHNLPYIMSTLRKVKINALIMIEVELLHSSMSGNW